jgi:hypothetical protein
MACKIKKSTKWNGKKFIPFKWHNRQMYHVQYSGKRISGHFTSKIKAKKFIKNQC